VRKIFCAAGILFCAACGDPKPATPALTPQLAAELLHYNNSAENWIKSVKQRDPSCEYRLDLPDQTPKPTEIDLTHIVWCGNSPGPREFDASVSFEYDKAAQRWVIKRFSS
jgi:hypothetical protein